jgi:hypothetical protein
MVDVQVEERSPAAGSIFNRGRRWWRALSWPQRAGFLAFCVLASWMLVKAATIAVLIGLALTRSRPPRRGFDAVEWNTAGGREIDAQGLQALRQEMVEDLLARRQLEGLSTDEVRELLGAPDWEGPRPHGPGSSWTYFLGGGRSLMSFDSEWLTIEYDTTEHVTAAVVHRG